MCMLVTGLILVVAGAVISFTGIGAVIGVPLALLGVLLLVLGFAGALVGVFFAVIKIILMIVFSPLILLVWLIRWLGHLIF